MTNEVCDEIELFQTVSFGQNYSLVELLSHPQAARHPCPRASLILGRPASVRLATPARDDAVNLSLCLGHFVKSGETRVPQRRFRRFQPVNGLHRALSEVVVCNYYLFCPLK